jgi:hypothetical protein
MDRDLKIKKLCDEGESIKYISEKLKIKYETIRSIIKKNNFNNTPINKGRKIGSYDLKQRIRKKNITGGRNLISQVVNNFKQDAENSIKEYSDNLNKNYKPNTDDKIREYKNIIDNI